MSIARGYNTVAEGLATRRLAAILVADVVGYSRLMEADEAGTLERLKYHRAAQIDPTIAKHHGRIIKLMGDGALVEFASVVDAVSCAVDIQRAMRTRDAAEPESGRIEFRIGINLGDLIVEGDDLYGDGLNIAARLESLAEPGGICVSAMVHQNVKAKLDLAFEDLGEQSLKNIAEPVRAYRVRLDGIGLPVAEPSKSLPLPDRPSIAVLPFTNMSGDPEQEYFSDGITEDIITELSRFDSLFVIARNSSFQFKGRSPKIQDVGRDLGVQYVVEGSVRKIGRRVRITAQLVESVSGNHLWAERYDRDLEDIFAIQDEVVGEIATAVSGQVDVAMFDRIRTRPTTNATAYEYLLHGEQLRSYNWGDPEAPALLRKAIEADPQSARAYAQLANWHAYSPLAYGVAAAEARRNAEPLLEKTKQLAPHNAFVLAINAQTYIMIGEPELALSCIRKAIQLNPNSYLVMSLAGDVLAFLGETDESLAWDEKTIRHDPMSMLSHREAAFEIFYMAGKFEEALRCIVGWRDLPLHMLAEAAATFAHLGRMDEAAEFRRRYEAAQPPGYDVQNYVSVMLGMCALQKQRDLWRDGFRKAGLIA